MLRPIVKYGDRILNDKAATVEEITTDVDRVIDEMVQAMHAAPGIGLAAPQIGVPCASASWTCRWDGVPKTCAC